MKIEIVDESSFPSDGDGRIEEIDDIIEVDTCFICNGRPKIIKTIYPNSEKQFTINFCCESHQDLYYYNPEDLAPLFEQQDNDEDVKAARKEDTNDEGETHFPFNVQFRPEVGRYMVAARDIKPGELIFTEEALGLGPNHQTLPCCLDCMKQVSGDYLCPECGLPVCEEMCAYGEEHSKECSVFSKLETKLQVEDFTKPCSIYFSITVLRVLLLKETDPERWLIACRMMNHKEEQKAKKENYAYYKEKVVDFLLIRCGLESRFSEEEVWHVLGALDVNSVRINAENIIQSSGNLIGGHGLYPITALLSHSCIANSKTMIEADYSCSVRATTEIKCGEEITKQYVSPLETTNMRREKLKSGWYFDCTCERCRDPTELGSLVSATRCLRCNGEGIILPDNPISSETVIWRCDRCPHSSTGEAVDKLVDYFVAKISDPRIGGSVSEMEELLEKGAKLLAHNHYVLTLIRIKLNGLYNRLAYRMLEEQEEEHKKEEPSPYDPIHGLNQGRPRKLYPGEKSPDRFTGQIPTEVYMRRKELLDDVQHLLDIVEPGLSRRRGLSLFETTTCHLQLGKQLHEAGRFSRSDFLMLVSNEEKSLEECLACLAYSKEGTQEAVIQYRAQGAIHECEAMTRMLQQDAWPKPAVTSDTMKEDNKENEKVRDEKSPKEGSKQNKKQNSELKNSAPKDSSSKNKSSEQTKTSIGNGNNSAQQTSLKSGKKNKKK